MAKATEIAAELGVSAVYFNRTLLLAGVIVKDRTGFAVAERYASYDLADRRTHVVASKSRPGHDHVSSTLHWTDLGRRWILKNWDKIVERANANSSETPKGSDSCPDVRTELCCPDTRTKCENMRMSPKYGWHERWH